MVSTGSGGTDSNIFETYRDEGVVSAIEEGLVPLVDHPDWQDELNPSSSSVALAQRRLAEEYATMGKYGFRWPLLLLLLLAIADGLVFVNAQVYGLSLSLYGAMLMAYPHLKGRFMIASVSEAFVFG